MSTEEDLVLAIKSTLETGGTMGKFKAEMRTAIMDILNSREPIEKPKLSQEILIINELIREYFTWMGYEYSKSVFVQESGLHTGPASRSQLMESLGVEDTQESEKFSLLHGIVSTFKEDIQKNKLIKPKCE